MLAQWVLLTALFAVLACVPSTGLAAPADPSEVRLSANGVSRTQPPDFTREVVPALTRAGCNAGACHGSFQGRGGFQLSLLGFDPAFDYEVLAKASRGRRINAGTPGQSLLLLKPMGAVPHGGGRRIAAESEVAAILTDWIAGGMPGPRGDELNGLRISVEPPELAILPARNEQSVRQTPAAGVGLRVVATYGDGTSRDVTAWAAYDVREKLIAEVTRTGVVTGLRPGKTAVQVRFQGQVAAVGVSVPYGPAVDFEFPSQNFIDALVAAEWKRLGIRPAALADDATFLRRVYLDLIGTLPTADETRAFLNDAPAGKRGRVIDELLVRPEYVDYWSLRWADLLRAHRRYLGDKGLASFSGWIRQSVRENKPLDLMTRELLTAQGNLFMNGPVAFFFIDEKVEELAETTSQVFLGVRLQCTRCHHHPNEIWSQDDYYGLAAFFSRLQAKDSGQIGSRFGGPKSLRVTATENPNRKPAVAASPRLFGEKLNGTDATTDPRQHLAEWITRPDNPYFARNFVNRYWAALMGRGLVEPVDDLRATNPAAMPLLFDKLCRDFAEHQFDPKHLLRTICNSRVYQLAAELDPQRDHDGQLFTHRVPRRLSAEVLLDAINQVAGTSESFDGQPPGTRAIALPDPTVASYFLTTFGRPMRNSSCDCARGAAPDLSQVLHLANSTALHQKLVSPAGRLAAALKAGRNDDEITENLYLCALGRLPNETERQAVRESVAEGTNREEAWQDVLWALINCAEFVFNH